LIDLVLVSRPAAVGLPDFNQRVRHRVDRSSSRTAARNHDPLSERRRGVLHRQIVILRPALRVSPYTGALDIPVAVAE
jgi:hypothetical protein